jgi:hypothetical protein
MLRKILLLLTLTVTLQGCRTTNYSPKEFKIDLPEMPLAGASVATELKSVCTQDKCKNLNEWLNRLYAFRSQYLIYREELKKQ